MVLPVHHFLLDRKRQAGPIIKQYKGIIFTLQDWYDFIQIAMDFGQFCRTGFSPEFPFHL
jgi:hypothetical protein